MPLPLRLPALLAAALLLPGTPEPLRVLRMVPAADADAGMPWLVSFDRPVAGSLDRMVDPAAIARVAPAAAGRFEWRDPVTLRFVPAAPLEPATTYTLTIDTTFAAMDGSRLERPFVARVRVRGPTLRRGDPVGPEARSVFAFARPREPFTLWYAPAAEPGRVAELARIELDARCAGGRVIGVTGRAGPAPDSTEPGPRPARPVVLVPREPLPAGCEAALVVPTELDGSAARGESRLAFRTHGAFRIGEVACGTGDDCPTGGAWVTFSTPVRGADVQRRLRIIPEAPFTVADTAAAQAKWYLGARLRPRTTYAVVADTALRDAFGQRLEGNPAAAFRTTAFAPSVTYPIGRVLVERALPAGQAGGLAVQAINVDTLVATVLPVPVAQEAAWLRRDEEATREAWAKARLTAPARRLAVPPSPDRGRVAVVPLPVARQGPATAPPVPTLLAVAVHHARDTARGRDAPVALVQVTDLAIHAKVGEAEAAVWVTGVGDGRPRAGAAIELRAPSGRLVGTGTTDAAGVARLRALAWPVPRPGVEQPWTPIEGYVVARLGDDRALQAFASYDPDFAPWRFNLASAWGVARAPAAGALFTERGIYRPGESVFAKAIVRRGLLGNLAAPGPRDSVRWLLRDPDGTESAPRPAVLSDFGTADTRWELAADAGVGSYRLELQWRLRGSWEELAAAEFRVGEYRPPEFLVDVVVPDSVLLPGEPLRATVAARYLFGAPMARAAVDWMVRREPVGPWELAIPGHDDWLVGAQASGWGLDDDARYGDVMAGEEDSLDAEGRLVVRVPAEARARGRAARLTVEAVVTDLNRQVAGARARALLHPASFYLAARVTGSEWPWKAGAPQAVEVVAVTPAGVRVPDVRVDAVLLRREWHRVERLRDGVAELVGEWVSDTVGRCRVATAASPQRCTLTPRAGGLHVVALVARDAKGRETETSFTRWAAGDGWVPWSDESQFKLEVVADRPRYAPGDTATLLVASPFTDAEAWITVEREGILESRRQRLTSGATRLRVPLTARHAPNVFVSVLVARGRAAPPARGGDAGRPTVRVGYAELRVTPERQRLAVRLAPDRAEYRPGDTARVAVAVTDRDGAGAASEVALWAVDEGILALTGYATPDPVDLLYQPRGIAMRLASGLAAVAPQLPEGTKGQREPGGGGGQGEDDVLRSRFRSTAVFLASVRTDSAGRAEAAVPLPDNLTTFRVMAVAVTRGDRFGSGQASLLVTRPVVARPALPRFLRAGDRFRAGTVVNLRSGAAATARVTAEARGVEADGPLEAEAALAPGRGAEVRFGFRTPAGDSARFRFRVASGGERDAVERVLPLRPDHHPTATSAAARIEGTGQLVLRLPPGTDPARSELLLSAGSSPLAALRGALRRLELYPYGCTEQVASALLPLAALRAVERATGDTLAPPDADARLRRGVATLLARQRDDGGLGYWGAGDWTTPWLTAHAGLALLDARDAGIAVDARALARVAGYLTGALGDARPAVTPVSWAYADRRAALAERVAAVDWLRRFGQPNVAAENDLLRQAALLALEDQARLAVLLARRSDQRSARTLLAAVTRQVRIEGRRATLPAEAGGLYFASALRPVGAVLRAVLALEPASPLAGPLAETLIDAARPGASWLGTQDLAAMVRGLTAFAPPRGAVPPTLRVRARGQLLAARRGTGVRDVSVPLTGLVEPSATDSLALVLDAEATGGAAWLFATVRERPLVPPTTPVDRGLRVERWIETLDTRQPVLRAREGDVVRVVVRLTVPAERQFVVLEDALPAGLEAIDLSLRTLALPEAAAGRPRQHPGQGWMDLDEGRDDDNGLRSWGFGMWDGGYWSAFEHRELRDDRVLWSAARLWPGTWTATYLARATTPGTFVRPPAHAEEMYNPAVYGRSEAGTFTVTAK
ncbi:MAG: MG2 domain-containing protein [Gemmatimonadales bacterium]|nr:MG2 domain-containing protein [Gemmatimonadales bacterium]